MYKSAISCFCLLICLFIPQLSNASVAYNIGQKQNLTLATPYDANFIKLDQKVLEDKIDRKLKWKEKIAVKIINKKLAKQAKKARKAEKTYPRAKTGFIFGLLSLLLFFIGFFGLYYLLFLSFLGSIIGLFVSLSALKKIKQNSLKGKGFALAGLIIGIAFTGFWLGVLLSIGLADGL